MVSDLRLSRSRQLLVDTNAFIYFLEGLEPYLGVLLPVFRRVQKGDLAVIVSVVTEAELLVRPERDSNEFAIERIGDLLSEEGIYVVGVDRKIARRAAQLRARGRMALADAIIVATAIETGCDAVLTNDGEWSKKISEVPIIHLDDIVSRTGAAGRAGDPKES